MAVATIETRDYFTSAQAANALGLTRDTVKVYCNNYDEGKSPSLRGMKMGRDWLIHKSEIARYKKERASVGRPRQAG